MAQRLQGLRALRPLQRMVKHSHAVLPLREGARKKERERERERQAGRQRDRGGEIREMREREREMERFEREGREGERDLRSGYEKWIRERDLREIDLRGRFEREREREGERP